MAEFLVDVNLPYYFKLWESEKYIHLKDINDEWADEKVWEYAKANNLTIISKDSDFSSRIILLDPPPKVIHIKIGNMKIAELHIFLNTVWSEVLQMNQKCKLVNVYRDKIEGIN